MAEKFVRSYHRCTYEKMKTVHKIYIHPEEGVWCIDILSFSSDLPDLPTMESKGTSVFSYQRAFCGTVDDYQNAEIITKYVRDLEKEGGEEVTEDYWDNVISAFAEWALTF